MKCLVELHLGEAATQARDQRSHLWPPNTECHRKVIPSKRPSMSLQYQTRPLSIQMCHCILQDDIVSTIFINFLKVEITEYIVLR